MKTIKIFSFAKFQAVLLGCLGIIPGILYSFGGTIYAIFDGRSLAIKNF